MTEHEGDRGNYLAWGIQWGLVKWSVTRGEVESDRLLFQAVLDPESQIVTLSPEGSVIICFVIPWKYYF
jgi:hypothetical protein